MDESAPWDYKPDPALLEALRPKATRRDLMLKAEWNVYSAIRGAGRNLRVSGDNPPVAVRGIVADYDKVTADVQSFIEQIKEPNFRPNWIEKSLSGKVRLVWVFEREAMVPNLAFCKSLLAEFAKKLQCKNLLAGYDESSEKPEQLWTNGGEWIAVKAEPMPWRVVFGVLCGTKYEAAADTTEMPLSIIHEEIEKRWPGRWKGTFDVDAVGVRFWDLAADNTEGCRVKPDGMQCFSGRVPFMKWEAIFGAEWCDARRIMNLGHISAETYFDGRWYWQLRSDQWRSITREDITLFLKNKELSARVKKGQTMSDLEKVLHHIQVHNFVEGVGPMINRKPGITYFDGKRVLNNTTLHPLQPASGLCGPDDFPFLWKYLRTFLAHTDDRQAVDYLLAWARRFYIAFLEYQRRMGQAIFLCGPRETGKTFFSSRILKPLLGDREANPYDYFIGQTSFNDELFEAPLLAINDEEATTKEDVRQKFIARIKSFVVNPSHSYHPKYCSRIRIEWTGRIFVTLNDDISSTGLLPSINDNTRDKLMFFRTVKRSEAWPENMEEVVEKELPKFARWLLDWTPPDYTKADNRMGVESFFDPQVEEWSRRQNYHHVFFELLQLWCRVDGHWNPDSKGTAEKTWTGPMTELAERMGNNPAMVVAGKDISTYKTERAITELIRIQTPGIKFVGTGDRRVEITREIILNPPHQELETFTE